MSSDKRQFLDPISTVGRIILLYFSTPKTKIRISNHTVQLLENHTNTQTDNTDDLASNLTNNITSFVSSISRTFNRDSRADICVLYPIFVRYIELYLTDKQKKLEESPNDKRSHFGKSRSSDDMIDSSASKNASCYKYLKKLGEYAIIGMKELQKTYGQDNASLTLQYYICLIKEGISGEYSENSLPDHLKELTKNNLLDDSKVQRIWEDVHIIELGKTFELCFKARENNDIIMLDANKNKILNILDKHDEMFKKMIGTDQ